MESENSTNSRVLSKHPLLSNAKQKKEDHGRSTAEHCGARGHTPVDQNSALCLTVVGKHT